MGANKVLSNVEIVKELNAAIKSPLDSLDTSSEMNTDSITTLKGNNKAHGLNVNYKINISKLIRILNIDLKHIETIATTIEETDKLLGK